MTNSGTGEYIFKEVSEEGGRIAMTTAMRLQKDGIRKGIQKGIQKGKIEDAKKMIQKRYSTTEIADITGLEIEKIEALRAELKM